MKVIAIVGMAGAGKSEAAKIFEKQGFYRIRFGDITDAEIIKRGLSINEENERLTREALRAEHGMAAYAVLNRPRIDEALALSPVVIDGLYSWEEFQNLKEYYGTKLVTVAVLASPGVRYRRLAGRKIRPLDEQEALSRDISEIENLNKGGPIAMADFNLLNEGSIASLGNKIRKVMEGVMS